MSKNVTKKQEEVFGDDACVYFLDYDNDSVYLYIYKTNKQLMLIMCSLLYISFISIKL